MMKTPTLVVVVLFGLGASACRDAASQPKSSSPAPAAPAEAFWVREHGKQKTYREACLTNIGTPFVVMIPSAKNAAPCDVDGEDDFAVVLEFHPCGDDARDCALPAIGATFDADLEVTADDQTRTPARVTVVRYEKPYMVVSVADAQHAKMARASGELRILLDSYADPSLLQSMK